MTDRGTSYIGYDDVPLERFENFTLPPMPAKDVVLLLAGISPWDYSRIDLPPDVAAEVRKLLVDGMMPENPKAERAEIEAFVDGAVADVRATITPPAPLSA
jgi:hypothetical protein